MKNEQLNDFQEKFLLFQECVFLWLSELDEDLLLLNEDLLLLKASVKSGSTGVKRHEQETRVIPFPARKENRIIGEKSEQEYFEERRKRKTTHPAPAA